MPKIEDMTTAQLEKENEKLMAERGAIKQKQTEIIRILDQRYAQERLRQIDEEAEKLRQTIAPSGVESEEAVGTPGD